MTHPFKGNDFKKMILVFLEIDKWDCMKLEGFHRAQKIITRVKAQLT